jgi:hypothetical protein
MDVSCEGWDALTFIRNTCRGMLFARTYCSVSLFPSMNRHMGCSLCCVAIVTKNWFYMGSNGGLLHRWRSVCHGWPNAADNALTGHCGGVLVPYSKWIPCLPLSITAAFKTTGNSEISDFSPFKTTGNSERNELRLGKNGFERSSNPEFQLRNSGLFLDFTTWRSLMSSQLSWKHRNTHGRLLFASSYLCEAGFFRLH